MVVVRALLPNGQRKWLIHHNQQEQIIECHPPSNATQQQLKSAEEVLDEVEQRSCIREEWVTVALFDTTAEPLPDAKWRSEMLLAHLDPIRNPHRLTLSSQADTPMGPVMITTR